jgi:hypothetical protein
MTYEAFATSDTLAPLPTAVASQHKTSDGVSGRRFNASFWDDSKQDDEAAHAAMLPYPKEPNLY